MGHLNPFRSIYRLLSAAYGPGNWWPVYREGRSLYLPEFLVRPRTPPEVHEICIGAILTQNTAWTNVEKALAALQAEGVLSFEGLLEIDEGRLSELIRASGYYRQKAKKLKGFARRLNADWNGDLMGLARLEPAEARKWLLSVWGVGPETADSILLYGFGFPFFVVDAYTKRVFSRVGLLPASASYTSVQEAFHTSLEFDVIEWREYHALIVALCKNACRATPLCAVCPLNSICETAKHSATNAL